MNRFATVTLILLLSGHLNAGVGPDSSWGELYQHRFYEPQTPTIPFYVRPSTHADGRLFLKKVHDVSYFKTPDGREWLYGGMARVCSGYSVTGSLSDSRRQCLGYEELALVRDLGTRFSYCTYRSDDDCQAYVSRAARYPLDYQVPVMYRSSESDSFTPARVAFTKPLHIPQCDDCAARLGL
jgi:hypothetical protein